MRANVTFNGNILQIEQLETKYDVIPAANSLTLLTGDRDSACIVQQLFYWLKQGYGEVIDGVRWIYKPVKEWISEVCPALTPYQFGRITKQLSDRGIIRREKLFTQHQIQRGNRFWWQPRNQTYYYTLNYERIQELADEYLASTTAESTQNPVFAKTQILRDCNLPDTKNLDFLDLNTKKTSTENNSIDRSHPNLPSEREKTDRVNQEDGLNTVELSNDSNQKQNASYKKEVLELADSSANVDNKINQNTSTSKTVKPKTSRGTKSKRKNQAPWQDGGQFKRFYRALVKALPLVANSHSPAGLAQTIIRQLRSGTPHSYWDDFKNGVPIGTSTMQEWEIEPGVPYPMFVEYLTEKLKAGNNTKTDEQTRNEVFGILNRPRQASAFWGQFKRSVVNVSEQIERDRALGVAHPSTPVWTRERIEPSLEEAAEAGQRIAGINDDAQDAIATTKPQAQLENHGERSEPSLSASDPWIESETEDKELSAEVAAPKPSLREMLLDKLGDTAFGKKIAKTMPNVSQADAEAEHREESQPKLDISQMSVAEVNNCLADAALRTEIVRQLHLPQGDRFEIFRDRLGQISWVA